MCLCSTDATLVPSYTGRSHMKRADPSLQPRFVLLLYASKGRERGREGARGRLPRGTGTGCLAHRTTATAQVRGGHRASVKGCRCGATRGATKEALLGGDHRTRSTVPLDVRAAPTSCLEPTLNSVRVLRV